MTEDDELERSRYSTARQEWAPSLRWLKQREVDRTVEGSAVQVVRRRSIVVQSCSRQDPTPNAEDRISEGPLMKEQYILRERQELLLLSVYRGDLQEY